MVYGGNTLRTSRSSGGAPSPTPLHPHPGQVPPEQMSGGQTLKHWDAGQANRDRMAPATSQSYGRTAGDNRRYWGGQKINDKQRDRRQEEEREMHARASLLGRKVDRLKGESRRKQRGGDQSHQFTGKRST